MMEQGADKERYGDMHGIKAGYVYLYKNAGAIIKYEAAKALDKINREMTADGNSQQAMISSERTVSRGANQELNSGALRAELAKIPEESLFGGGAYPTLNTGALRAEMVTHHDAQYWIGQLRLFIDRPQVHNADDRCLENSMYKLASFGMAEDDDNRIKETNKFIVKYLYDNKDNQVFYDSISSTIAASWLAYMGYEDGIVHDILLERVEKVFEFVNNGDYDIYISPEGYPVIPQARRLHPLVNPDLYKNNCWRLPTVHDMFTYAHLPQKMADDQTIKAKINRIIEYVVDARYQRLHEGYGLMFVRPAKYYSMGWSVHLDGYNSDNFFGYSGLVWGAELMSKFATARKSGWFKRVLAHLEGYCKDGIYSFPKEYLGEARRKYYVGGGHMGLGEDRRRREWREIESTAWMLRILSGIEK